MSGSGDVGCGRIVIHCETSIDTESSSFVNVGRMVTRDDGLIHIFVDGSGEIGVRPNLISPYSQGDQSIPETGLKILIDGVLYVAIVGRWRRCWIIRISGCWCSGW